MNNSPIDRSTLKSYFVKNAVPTQQQFSELIDSGLNLADDGLNKQVDTSLWIQASTGKEQGILELYRDFLTRKPIWRYQLNPLRDPNLPNSSHPGLALRDDKGRMRLYLQEDESLAGIGTLDPTAALHISPDMPVLRTVGTGNNQVQEDWSYLGLATDRKIALELGENGPGKIGSMKLNGPVANEFAFLRPGEGSLYLDTTAGDFYLNFDENVRRNKSATLHIAAADGSEKVRLATQGNSWLMGGALGLGTDNPAGALHVRVAGANGSDFNALSGKLSLQLGDATSKGSFLIQGGTANDRSFTHAHLGHHHLDASSGQYLLNMGEVSTGKEGQLLIGDAEGLVAVRLQTGQPGFLRQNLSIGDELNEAILHLHVPSQAELGSKTGGIKIESPDQGMLTITGSSIESDQPLRLQPNGGEIMFGGSLDVEERLSFDQDEFPDAYFILRDTDSQTLKLGGEEGISVENTATVPENGFQALLHFRQEDHHMFIGMDRDHLAFETANQARPLSIMKDGQVLLNQSKPLGTPVAARGRMDITGLTGYETYPTGLTIPDWTGSQHFQLPAQLVLSSSRSELAVAVVDNGESSTITQAVFNESSGNGLGYQMEIKPEDPMVMRWSFMEDLTGKNTFQPSFQMNWRGLHLDADKRRIGVGRGAPIAALDLEGSGTPLHGVQLLVRESMEAPSFDPDMSGATIGFTSPHFNHPDFQYLDHFEMENEGAFPPGLPPSYQPALSYMGLRNVVMGNPQSAEVPHLEIGSLYDLPIDFRINGGKLLQLSADTVAGQVEVGLPSTSRGPEDVPLTFFVHVPSVMGEGLVLNGGLDLNTGKAMLKEGLEVSGLADMKNDLNVEGILTTKEQAKLQKGLSVTGASTLNGTLTTVGLITASGGLEASQNVNLRSGVTVDGTSILNGNTTVAGTFTVNTGLVNLNQETNVNAALKVSEAATFSKTLETSGQLHAKAGAKVDLGLTVTGLSSLEAAKTSGAFTAESTATLKGITTIESALTAKASALFELQAEVKGKLTGADAEFSEVVDLKKGLNVQGPSDLAGYVTVRQDPGLPDFSPDDPMLEVDGLAGLRYATVREVLKVEAPYIQIEGGQIVVGGSNSEWYPVTLSNGSGRPALLEAEIWKDHDFYAKLRMFPSGGTARLDYREIEVFQHTDRYVADFLASPTSPEHVIWLKGGTTYHFRGSDAIGLSEGLPASLGTAPSSIVQTAFNTSEFDHDNIHIRRGALTQNRFESLVEPQN